MERKKINRQTYNILSSGVRGEVFVINKNNQYEFIKTRFRGYTVDYLYEYNPEMFIDFLESLWFQVNIVDKHNIDRIIWELNKKSSNI
jgi:hypothetical protein